MDGFACGAFAAAVIQDILRCNFSTIELLVMNQAAMGPPSTRLQSLRRSWDRRSRLLWQAYGWLDKRFLSGHDSRHDPSARVDCRSMLEGIPVLAVKPIMNGFTDSFPDDALDTIRSYRLDVVIRFGFNILRGGILAAARHGVWSYHHGDNEFYRGWPAGFWELVERNPLTGVILQQLTPELDNGHVLSKSIFATADGVSLLANRRCPFWSTTHLVIRKLHELHAHGWSFVESRMVPRAPYRGRRRLYTAPANREIARWLPAALLRSARPRPASGWRIGIRRTVPDQPADFQIRPDTLRWASAPPGHFYADPFLEEHAGRHWLFFEDYRESEKRATIACAEVLDEGSLGPVRTCLDPGFHVSYPHVFQFDGQFYMVPENGARYSVDLYRATQFPYEWTLQRTLLRARAADTNIWREQERWWMLTSVCVVPPFAAELLLFSADTLDSQWTYHPANPISTDVRRVRNAGRIFWRNGKRIRPSQDGSGGYGSAIAFQEIARLSPTEYEERTLCRIEPDFAPWMLGTHTYSACGALEAIDGKFPKSVLRRSLGKRENGQKIR